MSQSSWGKTNQKNLTIFMKLWFIFSITNVEGEEINSKYTLCYSLQKCLSLAEARLKSCSLLKSCSKVSLTRAHRGPEAAPGTLSPTWAHGQREGAGRQCLQRCFQCHLT